MEILKELVNFMTASSKLLSGDLSSLSKWYLSNFCRINIEGPEIFKQKRTNYCDFDSTTTSHTVASSKR